ncbi:MAG TPA: hypothetical protein VNA89_04830 [Gemmatimonadaceae bacterium]|nr:hypothetical protein [Gemmatimonadaceae bacterium]
MRGLRFHLVPMLACLVCLHGCTSWHRRDVSAGAAPAISSDHPVRITRMDGSTMVLEHPRVVGDSVVGDVGDPPRRAAVALSDVQRMDVRRVSLLRTGGLALGVGAAALGVAFIALIVAFQGGW